MGNHNPRKVVGDTTSAGTIRAMVAARLLLILGVVGAVNALVKPNFEQSWRLRPWWFFAMLTSELVPLRFAFRALLILILSGFGAFGYGAGRLGFSLVIATWLAHGALLALAVRARRAMTDALDSADIPPASSARVPSRRVLAGNPYQIPKGIERIENLEYSPGFQMDLYRAIGGGRRPALLQIHGGSWRGGNRRQQARPLLHELAARGWVTASTSYPLVPEGSVDDQLIALKRALVWLRTQGTMFGVDPHFIAVTGGSAGGHLASLVALTPNNPRYQPRFESFDTSVQAAVPMYGIYDLLNRNATRDDWPIVAGLMRSSKNEAVDRYRAASPLDQVGPHAPPFLVVHGTHDSVVSLAEADQFVAALRATSGQPVAYAQIPGATHAFDVVYSVRTHRVINGVERFLNGIREQTSDDRYQTS